MDAENDFSKWLNRDDPAEDLAISAVELAKMNTPASVALEQLGLMVIKLKEPVDLLRAAAAAVGRLPMSLEETADDTERARPFRAIFGVAPAEASLTAAMQAREWLEMLAVTLG